MNNNLEAGSTKVQRSGNAFCARLTSDKVIVGLLSFTLLLLSLIGAIVMITRTHTIADAVTTSTKSVTKRTLAPPDTSTPTITTTTTPTPTMTTTTTPTSTSTPAPTPTMTTTTTPAPTPTATKMTTPTSSSTSTPLATRTTSPSPTAIASPTTTAGATGTVTAVVTQNAGQDQGQTPTTSSNSNDIQSTTQDQQNTGFPSIAIIIGLLILASAAVIFILFIGWWLLRKRLLPTTNVKLPPSGAGPWSRVRTSETAWHTNANGGSQTGDSNNRVSNNTASWGYNGVSATMGHAPANGWSAPNGSSFAPSNVSFTSPYNGIPPATHGFVQANANNNFASSTDQLAHGNGVFSFNPGSLNQVYNAPVMPGPGNPETTRPQAMNNNAHEAGVYEQWLRNSAGGTPDLNDPYLKELIRQYSDKSRALRRQQKMDRQG